MNVGQYLKLVKWARRRYADVCGTMVLSVGEQPSRYSRIERAAWAKYVEGAPLCRARGFSKR